MASKTVSFRIPEELVSVIEKRAKILGKTKTDLVIEALAQAYDVPPPGSAPIKIESVQQQVDALREQFDVLQHQVDSPDAITDAITDEAQLLDHSELQSRVVELIELMKNLIRFFQGLPTTSDEKCVKPFSAEQVSSSTEIQLASEDSNASSIKLLEISRADNMSQLTDQINYQMQVFDQIFSAIPDLVFICDRFGHFTYVSPVGARVWGIERTEILGKMYYDMTLPKEFLEFHLSQFETALAFGKLSSAELSVVVNTATRYYDYTLSPIQNDEGSVVGAVGLAIDVTRRKQTELELQEALQKYRNLFELANDMIFIVDAESHQILEANHKASRRLRYTRKDLCQIAFSDIATPESTEFFHLTIIPQLEKAGSAIFPCTFRRKDGDLLSVEVSTRLIEYGDRLAFQSFARDVGDRGQTLD